MIALATMLGIGNIKWAPGTFASLAAVLMAYPLLSLHGGSILMFTGMVFLSIVGVRAANVYLHAYRTAEGETIHDPQPIVVDEWAGMWLTLSTWHVWLLLIAGDMETAAGLIQEVGHSPRYLFFGFVLFRFFDIIKPWPISWADRKVKGGFGVMLDDLLAGVAAGTVLFAIHFFSPLVSGQMMESQV